MATGSAASFATLAILGTWALDDGMRANTLLQWRFGLAVLVLATLGAFGSGLERRTRVMLFGTGLIYTVQTSLYFGALARISAGTTALLLYLAPAFVVLYSILLRRRPRPIQMVAVVVALGGLMIILGVPSSADASLAGLLMAAGAGAVYAWYMLLGELLFSDIEPLSVAAHSMAGAVVGFVLIDLVANGSLAVPDGARQWLLVAAVVIVPTLVAVPLLFAAIARIGAAATSVISTSEPVFTVVFAAIALSESVTADQIFGGAAILAAAVMAQYGVRRTGSRAADRTTPSRIEA